MRKKHATQDSTKATSDARRRNAPSPKTVESLDGVLDDGTAPVVTNKVALRNFPGLALCTRRDALPHNLAMVADSKLQLTVADDFTVRGARVTTGSRSPRGLGRRGSLGSIGGGGRSLGSIGGRLAS